MPHRRPKLHMLERITSSNVFPLDTLLKTTGIQYHDFLSSFQVMFVAQGGGRSMVREWIDLHQVTHVYVYMWHATQEEAQEASWMRGFDPVYTILFDFYHYLQTKLLSDFLQFEWAGVDIRWFSVDGFGTRWIPRRFSCGSVW